MYGKRDLSGEGCVIPKRDITEHQVRNRRELPRYARFWQQAREDLKKQTKGFLPTIKVSRPAPPATWLSPHQSEPGTRTYALVVQSSANQACLASVIVVSPTIEQQKLQPDAFSSDTLKVWKIELSSIFQTFSP